MDNMKLTVSVRQAPGGACIIDIQGDITSFAEEKLTAAYNEAASGSASAIILNFNGLEYMNSSGIGLLVTLLIRAQRQKQSLSAYGLSAHYQQIFELTRLDEAIAIYSTEAEALAALRVKAN